MIKKRYHFKEIDSTNKKAKEIAEGGCEEYTLITADAQQAGVGRRGRTWSSEEGSGIYMSMILRPDIRTESASQVTLIAALAVAKAIVQKVSDTQVGIKWPNDIVIGKKKVCGILTELSLKQTEIDYLVVGIGINVANTSFPEEIKETASSILLETGVDVDKETLITSVWEQFYVYYRQFLETQDLQFLKEEYESLLINKEMQVRVLDPAGEYTGIAKGITNKGDLIVEKEKQMVLVSSGEVSVRGIYGYVE